MVLEYSSKYPWRSLVKRIKRMGPGTDPCGSSLAIVRGLEVAIMRMIVLFQHLKGKFHLTLLGFLLN